MDQQGLYMATNLKAPAWGQTLVSTLVPGLMCPTDTSRKTVTGTFNIAWTNYIAISSPDWAWGRTFGPEPNLGSWPIPQDAMMKGMFDAYTTQTINDCTDGLSNTIIVAEVTSWGDENWAADNGKNQAFTPGSGVPRQSVINDQGVFHCAFLAVVNEGIQDCNSSSPWPSMGLSAVQVDGTAVTNAAACYNDDWFQGGNPYAIGPSTQWYNGPKTDWKNPGSLHPGITNVLNGDGSVSPVLDTIDFATWAFRCSICDGQALSSGN
jgi:hypothetical protein